MAIARFTGSNRIPAVLPVRITQILNTGIHDSGDIPADQAARAYTLTTETPIPSVEASRVLNGGHSPQIDNNHPQAV